MNDTLTQLFTHSIEYSPLESNSSGASQEIPGVLRHKASTLTTRVMGQCLM